MMVIVWSDGDGDCDGAVREGKSAESVKIKETKRAAIWEIWFHEFFGVFCLWFIISRKVQSVQL